MKITVCGKGGCGKSTGQSILQKRYEKNNLEMQPYRHYLTEYQHMDPRTSDAIWRSPMTDVPGFFNSGSWERTIPSAIRSWRYTVWTGRMERRFCVRIFTPGYWCCAISQKGIICRRRAAFFLIGTFRGARCITGSFTGAVSCGWPGCSETGWRISGGSWKGCGGFHASMATQLMNLSSWRG